MSISPAFGGASLRRAAPQPLRRAAPQVVRAAGAATADDVPDMNKRNIMNLMLLGATALPVAGLAGPFAYFFVPVGTGGGSGGQFAKDASGNTVYLSNWTSTHQVGDRSLVQGLKGDPTYLVVKEGNTLEEYGVNAVCTHLGCVVPWISAENKFKCPCHGSQYNSEGKVVRGPAPLSLALAHLDVVDDAVKLRPWTETDFRNGQDPWWA